MSSVVLNNIIFGGDAEVSSHEWQWNRMFTESEKMLRQKRWRMLKKGSGYYVHISFLTYVELMKQYVLLINSFDHILFKDEWVTIFNNRIKEFEYNGI